MNNSQSVFVFGTLRHLPLLRTVLGHDRVLALAASLPDHRAHHAGDDVYPVLANIPGQMADGLLLSGLSTGDVERLDYYELGFGYKLVEGAVDCGGDVVATRYYVQDPPLRPPGAPWSLEAWASRHGAVTVRTAAKFMAGLGHVPVDEMANRFAALHRQSAAEMRAQAEMAPSQLRSKTPASATQIFDQRTPFRGFFDVTEQDLTFPRFDGTQSNPVRRMALVGSDAMTVLPYDPKRDRVLLIEQYRFGLQVRGAPVPFSLEAVAGHIEPGESPQEAAYREAREEAGLALRGLEFVSRYYPSPGIFSEYIYSYVGLANLPDDAAGVAGLASEEEDIKSHVISFGRLMELIDSHEVENAPLVLSALWLAANKARFHGR